MPTTRLILPTDGESLDEAIADVESRYGVTATVVLDDLIELSASSTDKLVEALRGAADYTDEDLREHGLLDDDE